jgi:hypothetical protein
MLGAAFTLSHFFAGLLSDSGIAVRPSQAEAMIHKKHAAKRHCMM